MTMRWIWLVSTDSAPFPGSLLLLAFMVGGVEGGAGSGEDVIWTA